MSIALSCPDCQAKLRVADKLAGSRIRCPKCKAPARVPVEPSPTRPIEAPTASEDENPFAGLDDREETPKRKKKAKKAQRPWWRPGWRFYVTVGGSAACAWLGSVILASWGLGVVAFLSSLLASAMGAVAAGILGMLVGAKLGLPITQLLSVFTSTHARGDSKTGSVLPPKHIWWPVLILMLVGLILATPAGLVMGAIEGAENPLSVPANGSAPARKRATGRQRPGVLGALGGAVVGALPGVAVYVRGHRKKKEEGRARS